MSSLRSRFDRLRGWGRGAWRILVLTGKMALALLLSPLLLVDFALKRLMAKPIELPEGILSKLEMRAIQRKVGKGDQDALRLWLRSAFYYELVEHYGIAPAEAAGGADELVAKMNEPGGFGLAVESV